jgi:hypothetical protein
LPGAWVAELAELLGGRVAATPVPIPHDCADAFYGAFWRRPHAYLDADVRASTSVFGRLPAAAAAAAVERLSSDLESGAWHERNGELLDLDALDCGHRLVVAEYDA